MCGPIYICNKYEQVFFAIKTLILILEHVWPYCSLIICIGYFQSSYSYPLPENLGKLHFASEKAFYFDFINVISVIGNTVKDNTLFL